MCPFVDPQRAYLHQMLLAHAKFVSQVAIDDRNKHVERVAVKLVEANSSGDSRIEYSLLRDIIPKPPARPQSVVVKDGIVADTPAK